MASTASVKEKVKSQTEVFHAMGRRVWHRSAPKQVAGQCSPGKGGEGWETWRKHLEHRKGPVQLAKLAPGRKWPLFWSLPEDIAGSDAFERIGALALACKPSRGALGAVAEQMEPWLVEAAGAQPSTSYGLECVALAHALPHLAAALEARLWLELLDHLVSAAREPLLAKMQSDPLAMQLVAGELPLTLASQFPELRPCRDLWASGREALSSGIVELLDGEGAPHGRHLHLLRPLLACWTRAGLLAAACKEPCFTKEGREQYEWLIPAALRLTRHDGAQLGSCDAAGAYEPEMFEAALALGGGAKVQRAAALALPRNGRGAKASANGKPKTKTKAKAKTKPKNLPLAAFNSDWSAIAVLRCNWSQRSPRLLVNYGGPQVQIELEAERATLFSGFWQLDIRRNGRPLALLDAWDEICWQSDEDVDYLELEGAFEDGLRVQRQILLAREDGFLFLCDVLLGGEPGALSYHAGLPLAPHVTFEPASETRDGILAGEGPLATVMPLALPEWRADPRGGSLVSGVETLELRQQAEGRNLACPLFFDLNPRRLDKQLTWRQLTVADTRVIQPADVAVGYRVQCDKRQWLFYRSMTELANRTVLGQNTISEFIAARFDNNGDTDNLIEIE